MVTPKYCCGVSSDPTGRAPICQESEGLGWPMVFSPGVELLEDSKVSLRASYPLLSSSEKKNLRAFEIGGKGREN